MALPFISIIILNWNGLDETRHCLEAVFKSDYPFNLWEVFLVDNGSVKNEGKILKDKFSSIRLITSDVNLGFAGGNNLAFKHILKEGKAEFIALLNNDAIVDLRWLSSLVKTASQDKRIGLVTSKMLFYDQPERIENVGHDFLITGDVIPRGRNQRQEKFQSDEDVMGACGGAALYRTSMLKEIGFLRNDFFANYEDADLSLRAIVLGWRCFFTPRALVYHKHNYSIKKIRSFDFNLRSQKNQLLAYWYNMPLLVILVNLPFIILRDLGVTFVTLLTGRFQLLKIFWLARLKLITEWREIAEERTKIMAKQKVSSLWILKNQKSFLLPYLQYFVRIIIKGEKSAAEIR